MGNLSQTAIYTVYVCFGVFVLVVGLSGVCVGDVLLQIQVLCGFRTATLSVHAIRRNAGISTKKSLMVKRPFLSSAVIVMGLGNTFSDALRGNHCENFWPPGRQPRAPPASQTVCLNVGLLRSNICLPR